jgi:hypothetical protein
MTQEDKFKGIIERLKEKGTDIDPKHVSAMVIIGYLDDLSKLGLIESAFTVNPSGHIVRSICDEFEWHPSDEEIKEFVISMVDEPERAPLAYMIHRYRDDLYKFIAELGDYKKEQGSNSQTT